MDRVSHSLYYKLRQISAAHAKASHEPLRQFWGLSRSNHARFERRILCAKPDRRSTGLAAVEEIPDSLTQRSTGVLPVRQGDKVGLGSALNLSMTSSGSCKETFIVFRHTHYVPNFQFFESPSWQALRAHSGSRPNRKIIRIDQIATKAKNANIATVNRRVSRCFGCARFAS
jgi:hypothetical protein